MTFIPVYPIVKWGPTSRDNFYGTTSSNLLSFFFEVVEINKQKNKETNLVSGKHLDTANNIVVVTFGFARLIQNDIKTYTYTISITQARLAK